MTSTREQLKEAYRLIRQDQPEAAQQIIRPILAEDPENVHAWWLLAYSVDDPHEVRDALNKVLELDPDYSNAPKAREMLRTLDEQFFSAEAEATESAGYAVVETDAETSDETADESFLAGAFDYDVTDDADSAFVEEDDTYLATYDESLFETDLPDDEELEDEEVAALDNLFVAADTGDMTPEEKAAAEEQAAARSGRGRRVLTGLMLAAVLVLVVLAAFVLLQNADDSDGDPAALEALEPDSDPVASALVAARDDVTAAGVGAEQDALLAETDAGNTLFVEFCREPSRDLPQDIAFAMQIAVQHAVGVSGEIDAVGVSVNRCDADDQDTLYRAFVPVEDALSYINGELGDSETAWPVFQSRWQKP